MFKDYYIYIGSNRIGDSGLDGLVQELRSVPKLEVLDLCNNLS